MPRRIVASLGSLVLLAAGAGALVAARSTPGPIALAAPAPFPEREAFPQCVPVPAPPPAPESSPGWSDAPDAVTAHTSTGEQAASDPLFSGAVVDTFGAPVEGVAIAVYGRQKHNGPG